MTGILVAAAVGLFFTLLGTPFAIRLFRIWGWGQRIREDGPHSHLEKMGTPTMGGAVILGGLVSGYVISKMFSGRLTWAGVAIMVATLALGFLGFLDDFIKVHRRRSLGLNKKAKIIGQGVVAVVFALMTVELAGTSTSISFVRDTGFKLGIIAFVVWVFIMLAASSNAVNLTDGLDGLASGSSILVLAAFVIVAFWQFRHSCELIAIPSCYPQGIAASLDTAVIAAAAMGAAAGFLWWNAAPARIFMGDTGSLALGGLMAALAISTSTQLLLIVLGGLFVLETASVIAQVIAYRIFHRRVFRMAPVHHHFELLGWPEFTVIVRFWIIAGLCVAFGLGLFYADFIARGGIG